MAIRIDNSEAKTKFAETKEQIAAVRAEMDKLSAEGKKNSDEYKALKQRQDELNKSLAEYRKEGVRTSLSYAELRNNSNGKWIGLFPELKHGRLCVRITC